MRSTDHPNALAPRRRRLRPVGRRLAGPAPSRRRRRPRRLVVDRCAQVAERRLRLRIRRGARPGRASRRRWPRSAAYLMPSELRENWEYVLDSSRRRPRLHPVRRHPLARSRGGPGAGRALLRARRAAWPIGFATPMASRSSTTSSSTRSSCASATTTRTRAVIAAIQADGTAWMGGTTWQGGAAMRISVSNWSTTEADADRTADAILRSAAAVV